MPRPVVNLDPIGQLFDRALESRVGRAVAVAAPEVHASLRDLREHLPEAAAELEARVLDAARAELTRELGTLERSLVRSLGTFLQKARTGSGRAQPKRIGAGGRKRRPGGRG